MFGNSEFLGVILRPADIFHYDDMRRQAIDHDPKQQQQDAIACRTADVRTEEEEEEVMY